MTYESFCVQARLVNSIVLDTRFGIGLDSLLASAIREQGKRAHGLSGVEYDGGLNRYVSPEVRIVDLPLSKCSTSKDWHWLTTNAIPLDSQGRVISINDIDVRSYIQVDDSQGHEFAVTKLPANISSSSGRWKLSRGVKAATLAQSLAWTGHGSISDIKTILSDITSIGASRRSGIGAVREWVVSPIEASAHDAGHIGIDEKPARPLFKECLEALTIPIELKELRQEIVGIRPPYWHLGNQREAYYYPRK